MWNYFLKTKASRYFVVLIMVFISSSLNVWAQTEPESIVSKLSDEQVRELLLEELDLKKKSEEKKSAAKFNPAEIAIYMQHQAGRLSQEVREIFSAKDELPLILAMGKQKFQQNRREGAANSFLIGLLISFMVGLVVSVLSWRALRQNPEKYSIAAPTTQEKFRYHSGIVIRKLFSVSIFMIVSVSIFLVAFEGDIRDRVAFFFYLLATLTFVIAYIFFEAFHSPFSNKWRMAEFTDNQAKVFFFTSVGTIVFGALAYFTCALINTLGVGGHVHELFLITVTGMTAVLLSITLIINRSAISGDLAFASVNLYRLKYATAFPWLFSFCVIFLWVTLVAMELLGDFVPYGAALYTIGIASVVPHIDALLVREEKKSNISSNSVIIAHSLRYFVLLFAIITLMIAWQVAPGKIDVEAGILTTLANGISQSIITILIGLAVLKITGLLIDQRIAAEDVAMFGDGPKEEEMEIGGAGLSRTRTLLPLLKRTVQIAIIIAVILSVLTSMGVNTVPVLAGAGVLGLAIGFGSQTLVRDIVSGAFFLIDDAVRIGEYIDVGSVMGMVEKMSVRSLQLRHHRGAVHTIPFGEIKTLTNHSRDWAIMKLRFRLPFDTDLEKVRKLLKKAGQELGEREDIKDDFLQPFKSQGAIEADDYGFIVSTKFMSKPGKQFLIRRHAFAAVQKAFEENGIKFATPRVNVTGSETKETVAGATIAMSDIAKKTP